MCLQILNSRLNFFQNLPRQEFTVVEHDPNKLVTKLTVRSANVSTNGILLSIVGGDPRHHFRLDSHTRELLTTSEVDREYRSKYDLWIAAIDQHAQPMISYANVVINVLDINDNKPRFEMVSYSASVAENGESNELVLKIRAQDSDSGKNADISYSLLNDGTDAWKYFRIDEKTGEIFTITSLDAELFRECRLSVIARDYGSPSLSAITVVKIEVLDENDNSPRFSNLFHGTVDENSPPGTPIIQVTSYDADFNSTLEYGLEGVDADKFSIEQHTGLISLATEIDREKVCLLGNTCSLKIFFM
ncbi:unnamed protein product [Gongylonema pulchrum]|uniref:Cadherin domain-containing protein n=1 Tax=Gongylonema pulchrum TaxID=637853 RepID=A0A183ESG0_9BILA|nr:unnamed protein product [Gongylonema pulchrum]